MKFSIKDFFSKCDQIRRKQRVSLSSIEFGLIQKFQIIFFVISNCCIRFQYTWKVFSKFVITVVDVMKFDARWSFGLFMFTLFFITGNIIGKIAIFLSNTSNMSFAFDSNDRSTF